MKHLKYVFYGNSFYNLYVYFVELNSNLIKVKIKEDTGINISLLQKKNGTVLFATCTIPDYYVGRLFLNNYNIWYATIYDVTTHAPITSPVAVSVTFGYVN